MFARKLFRNEFINCSYIPDVIGLVDSVGEVKAVSAQSGSGEKKSFKREIALINEQNQSVGIKLFLKLCILFKMCSRGNRN